MLKHTTAENVVQSAQTLLKDSQHAANGAISDMSHAMDYGLEQVRDASSQVRDSAHRMSQETVSVIRHDPVKSVLIAAATGAVLMALVGLMTRSYSRH